MCVGSAIAANIHQRKIVLCPELVPIQRIHMTGDYEDQWLGLGCTYQEAPLDLLMDEQKTKARGIVGGTDPIIYVGNVNQEDD